MPGNERGPASADASPEKYSPAKATRSRGNGTGESTGMFMHAVGRPEADAAQLKRRHASALERVEHADALAARARVAQWGQYSPHSRDELLRVSRR